MVPERTINVQIQQLTSKGHTMDIQNGWYECIQWMSIVRTFAERVVIALSDSNCDGNDRFNIKTP